MTGKPWVLLNECSHSGGRGWQVKEESTAIIVRPSQPYETWSEADKAWSRVKEKIMRHYLREGER